MKYLLLTLLLLVGCGDDPPQVYTTEFQHNKCYIKESKYDEFPFKIKGIYEVYHEGSGKYYKKYKFKKRNKHGIYLVSRLPDNHPNSKYVEVDCSEVEL